MRLFRSRWLGRILPLLLLALLCAEPLGVVAQQGDGEGKDDFAIRAPQCTGMFSASLRLLQIKYGIDVFPVSIVPFFRGIISNHYVESTLVSHYSTDQPANRYRGPPLLRAVL
ncbi:MAG: hypothetical protein ACYC7J_18830 [Syntrophales bacterium]